MDKSITDLVGQIAVFAASEGVHISQDTIVAEFATDENEDDVMEALAILEGIAYVGIGTQRGARDLYDLDH